MSSLLTQIFEQTRDPFEDDPTIQVDRYTQVKHQLNILAERLEMWRKQLRDLQDHAEKMNNDWVSWRKMNEVDSKNEWVLVTRQWYIHKDYPKIEMVKRVATRHRRALAQKETLDREMKGLVKAFAAKELSAKLKNNPHSTITSIPPRLPTSTSAVAGAKKGNVVNPATRSTFRQFADHPAKFSNWSTPMMKMYVEFDNILDRNGKQELTQMYASTIPNSKGTGGLFNFAIIGGNGNFFWYKVDTSPGSGQNHVFINGKKMNSSTLMGMTTSQQDQAVAGI